MKTEVHSWCLSTERKAALEAEARRQGALSALLDRVTADWLAQRPNGHSDDDAEAARRRAMAAIGSVAGGDPTRSERASELVREIIYRKRVKESSALARRFGRRTHGHRRHFCTHRSQRQMARFLRQAHDNRRLPFLTTEAVLAEGFYLAERNIRDARSVYGSSCVPARFRCR
jgi:hypothetical protein